MSFYTDVIQHDPRFHSTECVKDVALLEPITRAAVLAILMDAQDIYGIDLFVTETYRSRERQQKLYAAKATKLKEVGVHHFGLAADFAKRIDGKASWDGDWQFLCDLARKHGMVPGGDWNHPEVKHDWRDWDHVQRISVSDQTKLFVGAWYPDDSYTPR